MPTPTPIDNLNAAMALFATKVNGLVPQKRLPMSFFGDPDTTDAIPHTIDTVAHHVTFPAGIKAIWNWVPVTLPAMGVDLITSDGTTFYGQMFLSKVGGTFHIVAAPDSAGSDPTDLYIGGITVVSGTITVDNIHRNVRLNQFGINSDNS